MWFSCDSHSLSRSTQTDAAILPKDADPDIPIMKEVKAEYAKLQ
jgi:hypothetical protein